jgi:hypothetical protein
MKKEFTLTMQNPRTKDQITRTLEANSAHEAQIQSRKQAPNFSVCLEVKAA